jgi:hypothetical protein
MPVCRAEIRGSISGLSRPNHKPTELPCVKCTCGAYAAKTAEHISQSGYGKFGVHGEVYLWGRVVEHERGWRAEFAYPKSFLLVPSALPFSLSKVDVQLKGLTAFGTDIFILCDQEHVPLWKNGSGYEGAGLEYLIARRQEHYRRRQAERTLRMGERVAMLGMGIAVVELANSKEVVLVLGNKQTVKVARKGIAFNDHNRRWECDTKPGGSVYESSNLRPSEHQGSKL